MCVLLLKHSDGLILVPGPEGVRLFAYVHTCIVGVWDLPVLIYIPDQLVVFNIKS